MIPGKKIMLVGFCLICMFANSQDKPKESSELKFKLNEEEPTISKLPSSTRFG